MERLLLLVHAISLSLSLSLYLSLSISLSLARARALSLSLSLSLFLSLSLSLSFFLSLSLSLSFLLSLSLSLSVFSALRTEAISDARNAQADAAKLRLAAPHPPAADIGHQSFDMTSFAPHNINATLHGTPAPPATSKSTGSTGSAGSAGIGGHKQGILRLGSIDAWRDDHGIAEPDVPATVSQLPVEIRSVAEWQEHNVLPTDSESGDLEMVEEHVPLEKHCMPLEEEAPTFMSESHLEPQFDTIEPVMAHTQFAPKADSEVQGKSCLMST